MNVTSFKPFIYFFLLFATAFLIFTFSNTPKESYPSYTFLLSILAVIYVLVGVALYSEPVQGERGSRRDQQTSRRAG